MTGFLTVAKKSCLDLTLWLLDPYLYVGLSWRFYIVKDDKEYQTPSRFFVRGSADNSVFSENKFALALHLYARYWMMRTLQLYCRNADVAAKL